MSMKKHLEHNVERVTRKEFLNPVEISRKLKSLQVTENKLIAYLGQCNKQKNLLEKDIESTEKSLKRVREEKKQIEELNDGMPVVTEHALLRYVERHMGIDLNKALQEILQLPDKEVVRHNNTIVTVFTDPEDHFNLAGRESK